MSDTATSWAREMGRKLDLKPTTRLVLLTLANDHGGRSAGFFTFHGYLAADCGMSVSALKSHLSLLRRARLLIAGDPQLAAGFPANARPNVYKLNMDIDPEVARTLLDPVDKSGDLDGQNLDPQNQTPRSAESSGIGASQNQTVRSAESRESDSQNLPTNPLKGVAVTFPGGPAYRPNPKSKSKSSDDGRRLCLECMVKHPMHLMAQRDDGRWICERHAA